MHTENDCQRAESVHGTGSNPWIRRGRFEKYVAQCIQAERAQKEADRALDREKATIAAENEAKKPKIEADRETEKAKIEAEKKKRKLKLKR